MSAFKILGKKAATVDELAGAFAEIEAMKTDFEGQLSSSYGELLRWQQKAMAGAKGGSKALETAKETYRDVELQIAACTDALQQIRQRIVDAMPAHLQQRRADLEEQHRELSNQQDQLRREWLSVCAQAAVLAEKLRGQNFVHLRSGEMREGIPEPGLQFPALAHDEQLLYIEQIRKARETNADGGNFRAEMDQVSKELDRLERAEAETEAARLIDSYRPAEPAPESLEHPPTGRPQHPVHVIDYDKRVSEY